MDELNEQDLSQIPDEPYAPRPKWQIWGARFVLVVFLVLLFMYYANIAKGGL